MRLTWSRLGFSSSLPNRPSSGQRIFSVRSMGATGRLALSCLGSSTMTLPPQQSTAASMPIERAGGEIGVAPARAEADHADLAVGIGLGAQELHAAGDVAHDLRVGDTAGGAHARAHVVGAAGPVAEIEVRGDGRKSVMGELAGRLLDPLVPAGHVMDQDHAGPGPAAERARVIGFAHVALVAAKGDGLREHAFIRHAGPRMAPPRAIIHPDRARKSRQRRGIDRVRPSRTKSAPGLSPGIVQHGLVGLVLIRKVDALVLAHVKLTSPTIWLPPGPLHSTWTAKVSPSRFLLRIVQRPNTESMSRDVIFTRETPASDASPLQT